MPCPAVAFQPPRSDAVTTHKTLPSRLTQTPRETPKGAALFRSGPCLASTAVPVLLHDKFRLQRPGGFDAFEDIDHVAW
jgi:hypothetical protein